MKEPKQAKQLSSWSIVLFGFFFLYLAFDQGEVNGNSVPLFLLGILAILYGFLRSDWVHRALLAHAHITEIDLEKKHQKKGD